MKDMKTIVTDGAPNLRDLGGYPAFGGKTVKTGLVFRSDDLNDLSEADLKLLAGLNIRTVVDFRDAREAALYPDRLPPTVRNAVKIPIEAGSLMRDLAGDRLTRNKSMGIMITVYRALVNDFQDAFRSFLALLAEPGDTPLLFHCTAGKDRTGYAAALFLSALGVERKIIIDDFMLSRELLKSKYEAGVDYDDVSEPLYSVYPEYIETAFAAIDAGYGGVEKYLTEQLGVDISRFRDFYTE